MQYIPNLPKGWLHAPAAFLSSFDLTEWGILGHRSGAGQHNI